MIHIFTEAGRTVGLGHLTRMRSLKNQLVEDGYATRLVVQVEGISQNSVVQAGSNEAAQRWINDEELVRLQVDGDDIVVVDTYSTTESFMGGLSSICGRLIAIDDYNRIKYKNCIVVNPNFYGAFLDYPQGNNCEYRLGSRYNLIRPEFRALGERTIREDVKRILITFGGTDVMGITAKTVRFCHEISPGSRLDVVVTDSFPDLEDIERLLAEGDALHKNIDATQMNRLMNEVDFAIASAGSTSNELMKTRCPSILIQVAQNQAETIRYLAPLGYFKTFDVDSFNVIEEMLKPSVRKGIYDSLMQLEVESSMKDLVEQVYDMFTERE